ncbi:MAG: N-acetylneuraminate synthase family protein [Alphaproteobacteria bacterium]
MKELSQATYLSPYIIAEIGVNHAGNIDLAKKMIEQVVHAGGHAAKFQTYKADKIASKAHSPYYWDLSEEPSESQHQLFTKYDSFGSKEYQILAEHCQKCGIDFMSTPFDLDAVDLLSPLQESFKIASADCTNIPLLRKVASKGKPILLSTGAAKLSEVEQAVQIFEEAGIKDITLLHCVLNYPTPQEHAQMALQDQLQSVFGTRCKIGYSDHVKPNENGTMPALEMAALKGAVIIEKHFTYDKTLPGNDHYHAMDEKDLKAFTEKLTEYQTLYGDGKRHFEWEKRAISHARRRIMANQDMKAGTLLSEENLIALRSEIGIEVSHWDTLIDKKTLKDISAKDPINWGDFE